jgi:MobA/VirD2-like, nuclease domain
MERLIYYLFGPGRHEEHTDPHLVAGWRDPAELDPPLRPNGSRDFRRLTGLLNQPLAVLGDRGFTDPVWHCVARAAPGDRMLSDAEWAQTAQEIMSRTGLCPAAQADDAVRWIAVRHGPDHIHIVATLARQDGSKPRIWNDFYRVRDACHTVENQFGLERTAPGDRTAGRRPTRAENERARRHGRAEPARVTLRRHVATAAAAAASEQEFFAHLRQANVMVRTRLSTHTPGQITGYAVALPGDTTKNGAPVWYSGGKLAADLTLPKLRHRWHPTAGGARPAPGHPLTWQERNTIWEHAARTADHATAQINDLAVTDPAAAADAAWAAADTLRAASAALNSPALRRAADSYDRAARAPHGRIPRPTPAGNQLRRTARLLSALAIATGDRTHAAAALTLRLAALADAVATLRSVQQHAAQAAAAKAAAKRLRAAATPVTAPPPRVRRRTRPRTPAELAQLGFPHPPGPVAPGTPAPGTHKPAPHVPRPSPGTGPPRPRGPAR